MHSESSSPEARCFFCPLAQCMVFLGSEVGDPSSALLPFLGEGPPTKIDYRKKGALILTSSREDRVTKVEPDTSGKLTTVPSPLRLTGNFDPGSCGKVSRFGCLERSQHGAWNGLQVGLSF